MPQTAFAFEVKAVDDEGTFEGIASTYNDSPDSYGDVIRPNAFSRTLSAAGTDRHLLLEHHDDVGKVRLEDSPSGLLVKGRLDLQQLPLAKKAYGLLKSKKMGMSFGYHVVKSEPVGNARHLTEIRLYEVSLTEKPANPNAIVTDVKSEEMAIKKISGRLDAVRKGIQQWTLQI